MAVAQAASLADAASRLSAWLKSGPERAAAQKAALHHYGQLFRPENLPNLTEEDFRGFLLIKNNKHWEGIHRQPNIYADMDRLRAVLAVLLDESQTIQHRLDQITDKNGRLYVKGLGRAVLTPILMCVYPDKYAVYNRISEEGLNRLGRNSARGTDPFGKRYAAINNACHEIAQEINQPLYLVDTMFSLMVQGEWPLITRPDLLERAGTAATVEGVDTESIALDETFVFPLEKFLEEFLVSNWDKTTLGKTLALHMEDDEAATQYATDVGEIDILARDKATHDWVVIELKKGGSSDAVVGQLLRYMGWVKKHKAGHGESVRGIIITSAPDDKIKYAMLVSQQISLYTYKVSFDLVEEASA
jgi:hypothetical protein